PAEQQAINIRETLITLGHASGKRVTEDQYQRLFLHVFKLLSQSRLKRLTRDELMARLALPRLNKRDSCLLASLNAKFKGLESRVDNLEIGLGETTRAVLQIQSGVEAIAKTHGLQHSADLAIATPNLSPP